MLSVRAGGDGLATLWTLSEGIVKEYPIADGQLWPNGMSGDGNHVVGWIYPGSPLGPHDASFDGSVTVGAMGISSG